MPCGHAACRPSRQRSWPRCTSMITAGSVRGKCVASQAWLVQRRTWPASSDLGRTAAHAAEAVALMPVRHAARESEQRALLARQQRADAAQIDEGRRRRGAHGVERRFHLRKIDREIGAFVLDAEQDDVLIGGVDRIGRQEHGGGRGALVIGDQILAAPHQHEARGGMRQPLAEPGQVLAQMRGAIDPAGVEIRRISVGCRAWRRS